MYKRPLCLFVILMESLTCIEKVRASIHTAVLRILEAPAAAGDAAGHAPHAAAATEYAAGVSVLSSAAARAPTGTARATAIRHGGAAGHASLAAAALEYATGVSVLSSAAAGAATGTARATAAAADPRSFSFAGVSPALRAGKSTCQHKQRQNPKLHGAGLS